MPMQPDISFIEIGKLGRGWHRTVSRTTIRMAVPTNGKRGRGLVSSADHEGQFTRQRPLTRFSCVLWCARRGYSKIQSHSAWRLGRASNRRTGLRSLLYLRRSLRVEIRASSARRIGIELALSRSVERFAGVVPVSRRNRKLSVADGWLVPRSSPDVGRCLRAQSISATPVRLSSPHRRSGDYFFSCFDASMMVFSAGISFSSGAELLNVRM